MFSQNNWSGYLGMLSQAAASIGLIGSGFVVSWIFGSEHSNRTIKDIISLPVARQYIVFAKLCVSFIWCAILFLVVFIVGVTIGALIGMPDWSHDVFIRFAKTFTGAAMLTLLLNPFVAYVSGLGKGIIAPLAFVILTMITAQFVAILGWGPYFPWTIPGLLSVSSDAPGMSVTNASYIILAIGFAIGIAATVRQWNRSDYQ